MLSEQNKSQTGRSMIEMLGVLAIVGILSAGGIAGYSMAMQSHKVNTLVDKIQLISQQARILYKGDYVEAGLTRSKNSIDDLVNAGLIPNKDNPFGGYIDLRLSGWGDEVDIGVSQIPAEACVKLLQMNWGNRGVFDGVNLPNASPSPAEARWWNKTWPVKLSDAVTWCEGGNKRMFFVYK